MRFIILLALCLLTSSKNVYAEEISYSLTDLNNLPCDSSVSVDKVLVSQDVQDLGHFSVRPVLSANAKNEKVYVKLYAGSDAYALKLIKRVKYEENMMMDFVWSDFFNNEISSIDKIHFVVIPETETDLSKPKTYEFPITVTAHNCDPDDTNYVPGGMSHGAVGTYLMPLNVQIKNNTVNKAVERDGIFVLLWTIEDEEADNAWAASECLFYTQDSSGNWNYESISSQLYTSDCKLYEGQSPFSGTWMKKGTTWSNYLSFSTAPQYVIPWRDTDRDAIPALYFDAPTGGEIKYGSGFYCAFEMKDGKMKVPGVSSPTGGGRDIQTNIDNGTYNPDTGENTDNTEKTPLDKILDFLLGTDELDKLIDTASSRMPISFFTYLPRVSSILQNKNYGKNKLKQTVTIEMLGTSFDIDMDFGIFEKQGHIIELVHVFMSIGFLIGTGFAIYNIMQKTVNFMT